ncbi:hypothetical protein [Olivibacter sitiensis]|uniref:hypothetical protein n=1 Tax=Olivibacter sitiensis TaxID=376470 RepID=UPI0004863218|nr:hypothetical protein [Olivibacter sitiensis]
MRRGKFRAMLECRCPQCRIGRVFTGSAYSFHKQRTNEVCAYCGLQFEIEPGYFYAAMYVSYAMSVAEVVGGGALIYFLTRSESPTLYAIALFVIIIASSPINYRYSRLILLYYLTPRLKYDSKYQDLYEQRHQD